MERSIFPKGETMNDLLNTNRGDLDLNEQIQLLESLITAEYEPCDDEEDEFLDTYMIEEL